MPDDISAAPETSSPRRSVLHSWGWTVVVPGAMLGTCGSASSLALAWMLIERQPWAAVVMVLGAGALNFLSILSILLMAHLLAVGEREARTTMSSLLEQERGSIDIQRRHSDGSFTYVHRTAQSRPSNRTSRWINPLPRSA